MKWKLPLFCAAAALCVLAGCTDHNQIKSELLSAVDKQSTVRSYTFQGSMKLDVQPAVNETGPLTGAVVALLKNSSAEWSGTADAEPRMEADMRLTPAGSGQPIQMAVIVKDNRIYFNIPPLTKPDEYWSAAISGTGGSEQSGGGSLKRTAELFSTLNKQWINAVDAKWINRSDETGMTPESGSKATRYSIELNAANEKQLAGQLEGAVPKMAELMKANGLVSPLPQDGSFRLLAPSRFSFLVDGNGYVKQQTYSVTFTSANAGETKQHIDLEQNVSNAGQPPAFHKTVPLQSKPIDQLLKKNVPPANPQP